MREPFTCYISNCRSPFLLDEQNYILDNDDTYCIYFFLNKREMTTLYFGENNNKTNIDIIYQGFCDYFSSNFNNRYGSRHPGESLLNELANKMIYCMSKVYDCQSSKINKHQIKEDLKPDNCLFKHIFSKKKTCKHIESELKESCHINEAEEGDSIVIYVLFKNKKKNIEFGFELKFLCDDNSPTSARIS